jgi:hypothetical protein
MIAENNHRMHSESTEDHFNMNNSLINTNRKLFDNKAKVKNPNMQNEVVSPK